MTPQEKNPEPSIISVLLVICEDFFYLFVNFRLRWRFKTLDFIYTRMTIKLNKCISSKYIFRGIRML